MQSDWDTEHAGLSGQNSVISAYLFSLGLNYFKFELQRKRCKKRICYAREQLDVSCQFLTELLSDHVDRLIVYGFHCGMSLMRGKGVALSSSAERLALR